MHEKKLLYGALGFTALASIYGVVHATRSTGNASTEIHISPVSTVDAKTLASAEVPIRLTSSDGTGLRLQSMRANAVWPEGVGM